MTGLATRDRAVRALGLHLRAEFASMYILVADRTSHIIEFVLHRSYRALRDFLVAVRTGDRYVGAGQRETCLLVFGQGEHRRAPSLIFQIVACLAAIQGRGRRDVILKSVSWPLVPLGTWHLSQATGMWTPSSGYFVSACSFTPNVEGAQSSTV